MQCVILAGGLGTRMYPRTERVPKALLEVAGAPFADHQLRLLASQGFADIVYSIGYLGHMIREHVGNGSAFGVHVRYVDEGEELRGTGGALRLALDRGVLGETFAVVYGDSYLPIAVEPVVDAFERSGRPALMTVYRNRHRWDASNAVYADGVVLRYEKGTDDPAMEFIDYGLGLLRRSVVEDRIPPGTVVDLAEVYSVLSREGLLAGYEVHERFYEIGSPEGIEALGDRLRGGATPGTEPSPR